MSSTLIATQNTPVRQTSAGDRDQGAFGLVIASVVSPRFSKEQLVCFIGGIGTIKNYQLDSRSWTYAVEMELGPEPDMGRIGSETTILLNEVDIQAC